MLLENERIDINIRCKILTFLFNYIDNRRIIRCIKKTALNLAVENGYYEIVKLLISHRKINVNLQNIPNYT